MPVVGPRPPQPGVPAALGPRPGGGPTMSPISAGASDQEKVNSRERLLLNTSQVAEHLGTIIMYLICMYLWGTGLPSFNLSQNNS
jgi:hypothetical protein